MTTDLDRLIEAARAGQWNAVVAARIPGIRAQGDFAWKAFSGSVDAAIALCEALLPGWAIERMTSWPGLPCRVSLWGTNEVGEERWHKSEDGRVDAEGPTLARALLLATLRAYRTTREGG